MLQPERYAHDGDAEQQSPQQMRKGYPNAADKKPKDIHHDSQTAAAAALDDSGLPERQQRQKTDFENLPPEGYADKGAAQQHPVHQIFDCHDEAAEKNPNNITDDAHRYKKITVSHKKTAGR